jgi:hypothetical protein
MPSPRPAVLLFALFLASTTASGASPARAPAKGALAGAPHPAVDTAETCEGCHAERTPEAHRSWFESRHGLMGVKCVGCHGSVGSGFTRRPLADRCDGCHGEKAAQVKAGGVFKGKGCFTCHPPHSLAPHRATSGGAQ